MYNIWIIIFSVISIIDLLFTWIGKKLYTISQGAPSVFKNLSKAAMSSSFIGDFWLLLTGLTIFSLILSIWLRRHNNTYEILLWVSGISLALSLLIIL